MPLKAAAFHRNIDTFIVALYEHHNWTVTIFQELSFNRTYRFLCPRSECADQVWSRINLCTRTSRLGNCDLEAAKWQLVFMKVLPYRYVYCKRCKRDFIHLQKLWYPVFAFTILANRAWSTDEASIYRWLPMVQVVNEPFFRLKWASYQTVFPSTISLGETLVQCSIEWR